MKNVSTLAASRLAMITAGAVLALGVIWPLMTTAQDDSAKAKAPELPAQHKDNNPPSGQNLATQITLLRAKVARLEAALMQNRPAAAVPPAQSGSLNGGSPAAAASMARGGMMEDDQNEMGGGSMQPAQGAPSAAGMGGGASPPRVDAGMVANMDKMIGMMDTMVRMMDRMTGGTDSSMSWAGVTSAGMGMMDDDQMGTGGMGVGSGGGMGMMDDDMDMMGMMGKGSMGTKDMKMKAASALPGFPGASHIYHIGATDFFLDHPRHITLSAEQQKSLNNAKQKSLLDKATAQRQIEAAEQALWELTSGDEPDAEQIQAKVQEIEKLRGEQRLAFIRSVGAAAKVLSDEQRQALLGMGANETAKPDPHTGHKP